MAHNPKITKIHHSQFTIIINLILVLGSILVHGSRGATYGHFVNISQKKAEYVW